MHTKQQINNNRTTALERTSALATEGGGCLNVFNWHQIFALDFLLLLKYKLVYLTWSFLTNIVHHHRETIKSN